MRQGGQDLTERELQKAVFYIANGTSLWQGLQGIDAENTAPLFDEALESLVQQYGYWERGYNNEVEYDRDDLRQEALRRALWAVLVIHGYEPYGNVTSSGKYVTNEGLKSPRWDGFDEQRTEAETEDRARNFLGVCRDCGFAEGHDDDCQQATR
jgi:hypothetical protein